MKITVKGETWSTAVTFNISERDFNRIVSDLVLLDETRKAESDTFERYPNFKLPHDPRD